MRSFTRTQMQDHKPVVLGVFESLTSPFPLFLAALIAAVCIFSRLIHKAIILDASGGHADAITALKLQVLRGANATLWNLKSTAEIDKNAVRNVYGSALQAVGYVCTNMSTESANHPGCVELQNVSLNLSLSTEPAFAKAQERLSRFSSLQLDTTNLSFARMMQVNTNITTAAVIALSFLLVMSILLSTHQSYRIHLIQLIPALGERDEKPRNNESLRSESVDTQTDSKVGHMWIVLSTPRMVWTLTLILFLSLTTIWNTFMLSSLNIQSGSTSELAGQLFDLNNGIQNVFQALLSELQTGHANLSRALDQLTQQELSASGLPLIRIFCFQPLSGIAVEDIEYDIQRQTSALDLLKVLNVSMVTVDAVVAGVYVCIAFLLWGYRVYLK